ncbi:MAG: BACON domain-containing carbohydrate-binding protein [Rikenellaceae bacterium]
MQKLLILLSTLLISIGCTKSDDTTLDDTSQQEQEEDGDDILAYGVVVIDKRFQDISCDWLATTTPIEFWVNTDWQTLIVEPADEWLSFDQYSGEEGDVAITLSIDKNTTFEQRTGKIKINNMTIITVTQSECEEQITDLDKETL